MTAALDDLVRLLDLESIEVNIFRGYSPGENRQRVFGGQVAGQALVAAARTVDGDRQVHSLHGYFLRPGDPGIPILYEVDRIRDGRSFTTRRVVAIQHGQAIFNLQASFHVHEDGLDHQMPMPDVPDPETLPDFEDPRRALPPGARRVVRRGLGRSTPGTSTATRSSDGGPGRPRSGSGCGPTGGCPTIPLLHACVVTYASDMTLLDTTVLPHGVGWADDRVQMASLDHAMWFHRPFRADEWLLYDQDTPSTFGSRGLASGAIFTRDGALVVSVMQEG